jgi:hypothetical protein
MPIRNTVPPQWSLMIDEELAAELLAEKMFAVGSVHVHCIEGTRCAWAQLDTDVYVLTLDYMRIVVVPDAVKNLVRDVLESAAHDRNECVELDVQPVQYLVHITLLPDGMVPFLVDKKYTVFVDGESRDVKCTFDARLPSGWRDDNTAFNIRSDIQMMMTTKVFAACKALLHAAKAAWIEAGKPRAPRAPRSHKRMRI